MVPFRTAYELRDAIICIETSECHPSCPPAAWTTTTNLGKIISGDKVIRCGADLTLCSLNSWSTCDKISCVVKRCGTRTHLPGPRQMLLRLPCPATDCPNYCRPPALANLSPYLPLNRARPLLYCPIGLIGFPIFIALIYFRRPNWLLFFIPPRGDHRVERILVVNQHTMQPKIPTLFYFCFILALIILLMRCTFENICT